MRYHHPHHNPSSSSRDRRPPPPLVAPVLQLNWNKLFQSDWPWTGPQRPIPDRLNIWSSYPSYFELPTLENFRVSLAKKLSETANGEIRFSTVDVLSVSEKTKEIFLMDSQKRLNAGDVCLIAKDNPVWRKRKKQNKWFRPWHPCNWLLVKRRDKANPNVLICEGYSLNFVPERHIFFATIDSATTANRLLKSFENEQITHEFHANNPSLCGLILSGGISTLSHRPKHTFHPAVHPALNRLNQSQLTAVKHAAAVICHPQGSVALIQGPPGTGKTTCIVTLLMELLHKSICTAMTAPTNVAVLGVAKSLIIQEAKPFLEERIVIILNEDRLEERAMLDDHTRPFLLQNRVHSLLASALTMMIDLIALIGKFISTVVPEDQLISDEKGRLKRDKTTRRKRVLSKNLMTSTDWWQSTPLKACKSLVIQQISSLVKDIRGWDPAGKFSSISNRIKQMKDLKKCLRPNRRGKYSDRLVEPIEKMLVKRASLVFCTLSGTKAKLVKKKPFQAVVVDEAAQAIEAEMIGLFKKPLKSLVLVGDPRQLPGTVFSKKCVKLQYQRSLFERLASIHHYPVSLLAVQYRMHPSISAFPNEAFYRNQIEDSDRVLSYCQLWYSKRCYAPLKFVTHTNTTCSKNPNRSSYNDQEALKICNDLALFLQSFPNSQLTIGIIAPYLAQKELIQEKIKQFVNVQHSATIEVNTVDGFQGQERDIIVFSLTRTGTCSDFLNDKQRMNVAITRSKYALWIYGDDKLFARENRSNIWNVFALRCRSVGALKPIGLIPDNDDPSRKLKLT